MAPAPYRDPHHELLDLAERRRAYQRARRQLASATTQRDNELIELAECKRELAKEEHDVDKVTGRTLTALFITLTGGREQRVAREQAEADLAKARCETQQTTVDQLEQQVTELQQQLATLGDPEAAYQRAFASKAQAMLDEGGESGKGVAQLCETLADARAELRETNEAIVAGEQVLQHARAAKKGIPSTNTTTSFVPIGTMVIPMVTENKLESAVERHLWHAQRCGFRFVRELEDLKPWMSARDPATPTLPLGSLLRGYAQDLFQPGTRGEALDETRRAVGNIERRVLELLHWLNQARESAQSNLANADRAYVDRVTHG